ncbi:hypothetical protein DDB_G0282223 [Dictyostelium discoideum AX4]|uniref:hypothetical protein n=1 Tax=Dictyostelium discoideum AX4 TaxID=352472 RepID=UPI00004E3294|nr:hypothetical protein DDB_G0282223 [Dictyostelium discoideum AX4]EAL66317.1 hypothetical protein DDB_G0282223 [Dictyostelium discoideum AX4]|eukprot:XP_640294.1 hypothetical protein DDB_G0282223 [Dictyostelium discoideum AX4]
MTMITIDYIKDIIKRSDKLSEEIDPDQTPYKSKYEAIELLKELKKEINENEKELNQQQQQDILDYLVVIDSKLGELFIATEEITLGLNICRDCLKSLESIKNKFPLETISTFQSIAIIDINKNHFENGKQLLIKSENLINQTIEKQQEQEQEQEQQFKDKLESLQLQNYFYFAQLYGLLKDSELVNIIIIIIIHLCINSSKYCELTLRKQLKRNNFDRLEWCKNSLMLAEYYLSELNFDYAKQCFLVSNYICKGIENEDDREETQANIYLVMAKFYLEFLHFFRDIENLNHCHRVNNNNKNNNNENDIDFVQGGLSSISLSDKQKEKEKEDKLFNENQIKKEKMLDLISFNKRSLNIDKPLFTELGSELLDKIYNHSTFTSPIDLIVVKDQPSARDIFLKSQHFFNKSKKYYKLDGFVSQHIKILFDQINLFEYLNMFESNAGRKIGIHKKKIELIQPLLKELNPTYFLSSIRSIYFKIAEIYSEISKIYQCVCTNLREIQTYNECYNDGEVPNSPKITEEEKMKSIIEDFEVYINAKLELAVCHKNVKGVNKLVLEHLEKSLNLFRSIITLLDSVPKDISSRHTQEYHLCSQMSSLLPQKIQFLSSNKTPNPGQWDNTRPNQIIF